jgi:hypothetical protein
MWVLSWDDVPTRSLQTIDSKKPTFSVFFSGDKLIFLDSLPKDRNMDSDYFYNSYRRSQSRLPCWDPKIDSEQFPHPYGHM